MPRWAVAATLGLLVTAAAGAPETREPSAGRARECVLQASVEGLISTATAEYLGRAIEATRARGCTALLITIDTPGGSLEATRRIVRDLLNAPVAVLAYVSPSGAHAGSAGMFVTLAAHIAAMAPGTSIGAAHPVLATGQDIGKPGDTKGGKESDLAEKIVNDTAAMARGIAFERGRNAAWVEEAVRRSVSITDREAQARGVIDVIADSPGALLAAVDGRTVTLAAGVATRLATRDAVLTPVPMSVRQQAIAILANPNLAYLLLILGLLGLFVELSHPGFIAPGVLGGLALLLAAVGLEALPVNVGALLLILAAIGLFVAEVYVTSHGVLAAGGLVCLVVGSALLIDSSSPEVFSDVPLRVSFGVIVPLALVIAAALAALVWEIGHVRRRRSPTGSEGLIGARAVALTDVGARGGQVRVQGERWQAVADVPIAAGETTRILAVDGLTLRVAPARDHDPASAR